ncbi:hypothetical protein HOY82DRAFT_667532 [Tuber indicum]|nr:hypothetical protein HOY82DRAFT_667532 [Tuber indicum]
MSRLDTIRKFLHPISTPLLHHPHHPHHTHIKAQLFTKTMADHKLSSPQLSDSQAAMDQPQIEQEQALDFHPDKNPDKVSSPQLSDSQAAIDQLPIEQEQAISFHTHKDHLHLFLQETIAMANLKQKPAESQKKTYFNSLLDALEDAKLRLGGGSAENNPAAARGVHAGGVFPFSILAGGGGGKRGRAFKAFWRAVDEEEGAVNSGNDNFNEGCELCPQCGWEVKYQVGRDGRVTLSIMDEENENIFKGRGRVQALKVNPANHECQRDEEGGGVSLFKGQDSDDGGVCLSEARDIECRGVKLYQHADTQAPLPVTRKGKDAGGHQDSSESAQGTDGDHEGEGQDNSGPAQETGCNNSSRHKSQMNLPQ